MTGDTRDEFVIYCVLNDLQYSDAKFFLSFSKTRCLYISATDGWIKFNWFNLGQLKGIDMDSLGVLTNDWDNNWLVGSIIMSAGSILMGIYSGYSAFSSFGSESKSDGEVENGKAEMEALNKPK